MIKLIVIALLASSTLFSYEMNYDKNTTGLVRHLKVYEHPRWISKVELKDGKEIYFSSPKSMFEFYHRPGKWYFLNVKSEKDLKNIRVLYTDGVQVLRDWVPDSSLTAILAFFPDPWQKKRHHKRRLFRAEIIELMIKKLKPNGEIIIATDWGQYAEEILELLPNSGKTVRPSWRPETKYERKGRLAGREITEIRAKV